MAPSPEIQSTLTPETTFEESFETHAAQLRDELTPGSPLQELAFMQFARASWNLLQLRQAETEILGQPGFHKDAEAMRTLDILSRQSARLEKSMRDAFNELQRIQDLYDRSDEVLACNAGADRDTAEDESDDNGRDEFISGIEATAARLAASRATPLNAGHATAPLFPTPPPRVAQHLSHARAGRV